MRVNIPTLSRQKTGGTRMGHPGLGTRLLWRGTCDIHSAECCETNHTPMIDGSLPVDGYSARRAAQGSILVARRAGSHAAISPTAIRSSVTMVNAMGSVGVTPNRKV